MEHNLSFNCIPRSDMTEVYRIFYFSSQPQQAPLAYVIEVDIYVHTQYLNYNLCIYLVSLV